MPPAAPGKHHTAPPKQHGQQPDGACAAGPPVCQGGQFHIGCAASAADGGQQLRPPRGLPQHRRLVCVRVRARLSRHQPHALSGQRDQLYGRQRVPAGHRQLRPKCDVLQYSRILHLRLQCGLWGQRHVLRRRQ